MKALYALALGLVLAASAHAQNSTATVVQNGPGNQTGVTQAGGATATVEQTSTATGNTATAGQNGTSTADIDQSGDGNTATASQLGNGNTAGIDQTGTDNTGEVAQDGQSNTAALDQDGGTGNEAYVSQTGDFNAATVDQGNLQGGWPGTGSNNYASVTQTGDRNTAIINNPAFTHDNTATVIQHGIVGATMAEGNYANVWQDDEWNAASNIEQTGVRNFARTTQSGAGFGEVSVTQTTAAGSTVGTKAVISQVTVGPSLAANGNNAFVTQVGGGLGVDLTEAVIGQRGTKNTATLTLQQDGGFASVGQYGDDNTVLISEQSGGALNSIVVDQGLGSSGAIITFVTGNTATLSQIGGTGNTITVSQMSDGNLATVNQNGSGNTATIMQN